jgi:hypothetical protein
MDGRSIPHDRAQHREHPRTIGWLGTSALAMGGSNQMVFLSNLPRSDAGPPALAGVPSLET